MNDRIEQELNRPLSTRPVFKGFSAVELDAAFRRVAPEDDWRGEIDYYVRTEDLYITLAAIEFYTATECIVTVAQDDFRVQSIGYRAGPAGPAGP